MSRTTTFAFFCFVFVPIFACLDKGFENNELPSQNSEKTLNVADKLSDENQELFQNLSEEDKKKFHQMEIRSKEFMTAKDLHEFDKHFVDKTIWYKFEFKGKLYAFCAEPCPLPAWAVLRTNLHGFSKEKKNGRFWIEFFRMKINRGDKLNFFFQHESGQLTLKSVDTEKVIFEIDLGEGK